MSEKDKKIAVAMTETQEVSEIMEKSEMKKSEFSPYRARLIKRGLAYSPERGKLCFLLPRFAEFVEVNY